MRTVTYAEGFERGLAVAREQIDELRALSPWKDPEHSTMNWNALDELDKRLAKIAGEE